MLREHLLWINGHDSDFISWSSSVLWTLEHAARMHTTECKGQVHVAVIDTRKIQDMAFSPAVKLMEVYKIPEVGDEQGHKLNRDYNSSEYLFHGPLRNTPSNSY